MAELHKCRFCGGEAEARPDKEEFEDKELNCIRITCRECNNVDIWAFRRETEHKTYDEVIDLAAERWNTLMEEK